MGPYLALIRAGFRRQASHRGVLLAGVTANIFFGIFRSAIFESLHAHRSSAGGLGLSQALTYVWMVQVLFGVIFVSWIWEFPESVRSGDFVAELLRPGDLLARLAAIDLGRTLFGLLVRGLPMLVFAAFVWDLDLPTDVLGWLAVAVSVLLSCLAAFHYRFAFGAISFWTPDFRGWWAMFFAFLWIAAGIVVPVELFPAAIRTIALDGPLAALLIIPYRVVLGRHVMRSLFLQAGWVVAGAFACRWVIGRAERELVVHGG